MTLLLYACCLFATSLSSPSLGTFFGVPSWLGDPSVASDRTYGSPDATNATHRIDNEALKAVAALFEAYEERSYYASEGPSNVWDVATWGPTARGANKVPFRFDFGTSGFVYDSDTNRLVATRRFVEYANVDALASALSRYNGGSYFDMVNLDEILSVERPLWRSTYDGWRWSSTLFDRLRPEGDVPRVPTFDWSPSALLEVTPNQWGCSALTWNSVASDAREYRLNWTSVGWSEETFAVKMLRELNYGETPFDRTWWPDLFGGIYMLTNTTEDVLSPPFDVWMKSTDRRMFDVYAHDTLLADNYSSQGISLSDQVGYIILTTWFDIQDWETFGVQAQLEDFYGPAVFASGHWESQWMWSKISVTRDSTGETAGPFNYPAYVDIPLEGLSLDSSKTSDLKFESFGDMGVNPCWFTADVTYFGGFTLIMSIGPDAAQRKSSYHMATFSYPVDTSNSVCKVGVFATNDTRRLVTDRVAGLGQALSALDRTYARMDADAPPAEYVRFDGTIDCMSAPVKYGNFHWSEFGLMCDDSVVPFEGFAEMTNCLYVTNATVRFPGYVVAGCSSSDDRCILNGCSAAFSNITRYAECRSSSDLLDIIGGPTPEERVFLVNTLTVGGGSGYIVFQTIFKQLMGDEWVDVHTKQWQIDIPIPDDGIELTALATYSRSYSEAKSVMRDGVTFGQNDESILYPGSFGRVASASLWTLESFIAKSGMRFSDGIGDPLFTGDYVSGCDAVQYRSQVYGYASHTSLIRRFYDIISAQIEKCGDYVLDVVGVRDVGDPREVIPMKAEDATAVLDGNVVPQSNGGGSSWKIGSVDGGASQPFAFSIVGEDVWSFGPEGKIEYMWPMRFAEAYLSGGCEIEWRGGVYRPPSCVRRYGAAAKAKMRGLSKVDWNWGALRLETSNERNNQ